MTDVVKRAVEVFERALCPYLKQTSKEDFLAAQHYVRSHEEAKHLQMVQWADSRGIDMKHGGKGSVADLSSAAVPLVKTDPVAERIVADIVQFEAAAKRDFEIAKALPKGLPTSVTAYVYLMTKPLDAIRNDRKLYSAFVASSSPNPMSYLGFWSDVAIDAAVAKQMAERNQRNAVELFRRLIRSAVRMYQIDGLCRVSDGARVEIPSVAMVDKLDLFPSLNETVPHDGFGRLYKDEKGNVDSIIRKLLLEAGATRTFQIGLQLKIATQIALLLKEREAAKELADKALSKGIHAYAQLHRQFVATERQRYHYRMAELCIVPVGMFYAKYEDPLFSFQKEKVAALGKKLVDAKKELDAKTSSLPVRPPEFRALWDEVVDTTRRCESMRSLKRYYDAVIGYDKSRDLPSLTSDAEMVQILKERLEKFRREYENAFRMGETAVPAVVAEAFACAKEHNERLKVHLPKEREKAYLETVAARDQCRDLFQAVKPIVSPSVSFELLDHFIIYGRKEIVTHLIADHIEIRRPHDFELLVNPSNVVPYRAVLSPPLVGEMPEAIALICARALVVPLK